MIDTQSEPGAWQRALDRGCLQRFPDAVDGSSRVGKAPRFVAFIAAAGCALAGLFIWARAIGDPVSLGDEPLFIGGASDANHGECR